MRSEEVEESYRPQGPPDGVIISEVALDGSQHWPRSFEVTVEELTGWILEVEVQPLELGLGITKLTIQPASGPLPAIGLSSSNTKRLRLARVVEAIVFELEAREEALAEHAYQSAAPSESVRTELQSLKAVKRPGRAGHDAATLRFVAELRLSAEARRSNKPNEEIAGLLSTLKGSSVSAAYVTSLVGKATKAGWLGPAGSGRSLRTPGPRLIAARQATSPGS